MKPHRALTIRITRIRVAATVVLCATMVGCHTQNQPPTQIAEDGIVVIGVVGGTDEKAKSDIKAILHAHGIEPIPEGAFVSGVLVSSKEEAEKAVRILSAGSKRKYGWEFLVR